MTSYTLSVHMRILANLRHFTQLTYLTSNEVKFLTNKSELWIPIHSGYKAQYLQNTTVGASSKDLFYKTITKNIYSYAILILFNYLHTMNPPFVSRAFRYLYWPRNKHRFPFLVFVTIKSLSILCTKKTNINSFFICAYLNQKIRSHSIIKCKRNFLHMKDKT